MSIINQDASGSTGRGLDADKQIDWSIAITQPAIFKNLSQTGSSGLTTFTVTDSTTQALISIHGATLGQIQNEAGHLYISNADGSGDIVIRPGGFAEYARFKSNGVFQVIAGLGTGLAKVGGALFDHYADVGNGTTVETDLYSDTIPASTLSANGAKLEAEYGGVFVSSATATRQIKLYFGGTAIFDTGALTLSLSSAWTIYASLIRVSSTVVRYMISLATEGAALSAYTAVGELTGLTLSNTNILKITGQAAGVGAASNDIVAKLGNVTYVPAA